MANLDNLCMVCKKVDFCHYRQMSQPSVFLSDGSDIQSDGGDKNLRMAHKEGVNIVFDHNWYNYSLLYLIYLYFLCL